MGKHIKSLIDAAHAAGFAMAPEDMYAEDVVVVRQVMAPSASTALVPYAAATPALGIMAHARAIAARYGSPGWLMPRLTA